MTFAQVYYLPTNELTWVLVIETLVCKKKTQLFWMSPKGTLFIMVNDDILSAVWSTFFGETKLRMLKDLSEHRPPVNLCLSNGLMK